MQQIIKSSYLTKVTLHEFEKYMLYQNNSFAVSQSLQMSKAACQVLNTLIYFDVFHYPLTDVEIFERSIVGNLSQTQDALKELVANDAIFCINGFYSLHNNKSLIKRRLKGNQYAEKSLVTAKRITKIIKLFPYVRAVMLSGSISKNYMEKNSDIDYFIITKANRLWVCRLFFVLVQKIIFFNRYKYFCYNYMVDENHVAITDQSFYTAIEGSSLLPVYNFEMYQHFRQSNLWMQAYFPNFPMEEKVILDNRQSWIQRILEICFNNSFGEWLDKWLMKKIEAKWHCRHQPKMFTGTKNLQLKRHTAKAHTEGHYNRIMDLYNAKKTEYEDRYKIIFTEKTHLITPIKINA